MSQQNRSQKNIAELLKKAEKCELCGSTRSLNVHHIVPVTCGGDNDLENLIVICEKCHALLTPRSYLTNYGLKKIHFWPMVRQYFYLNIDEDGGAVGVMDTFDKCMDKFEKKFEKNEWPTHEEWTEMKLLCDKKLREHGVGIYD